MSDGSSVLHTTVLRSEHSIYKQSNIIQESIQKLKEKDNESIFSFYFRFQKHLSTGNVSSHFKGVPLENLFIYFFTFDQFSSNKNHFFIFIINPPEKAKHAVEFFSYLYWPFEESLTRKRKDNRVSTEWIWNKCHEVLNDVWHFEGDLVSEPVSDGTWKNWREEQISWWIM